MDDFDEAMAGLDRVIRNEDGIQEQLLEAGLLVRICRYRHRSWSKPCGKLGDDPVHYALDGTLAPAYGDYSGPVRHPFDASDAWDPWTGDPTPRTNWGQMQDRINSMGPDEFERFVAFLDGIAAEKAAR